MGYQESYFKIKESKHFGKLVKEIKKYGKDKFNGATPVEIITLLKPIQGNLEEMCHAEVCYDFSVGEKFVYVIDQRYNQKSANTFFENCSDVDNYVMENLEIYFTECFPSYDIFENNDKLHYAKHEPIF